jgi:chromosome segregation ATPase
MKRRAAMTPRAGLLPRRVWVLLWAMMSLPCLALATEQLATPKQTSVVVAPGADLQPIKKALTAAGSQITHSVTAPDGSMLLSVDQPVEPSAVNEFHSQLRNQTGVTQVEDNVCLEIYPVDNASQPITLNTVEDPEATPENLIGGGSLPWSSGAVETLGDGQFSTGTTVGPTQTRPRGTSISLRAYGWNQTREYPTPPTAPPEDPYQQPLFCDVPTTLKVKGPEPKVALKSGDSALFPYPRPLPLQALVRDFDEIQFGCIGCGSQKGSNQRLFIEDQIGNYKWELVGGKGSLNDPFVDLDADLDAQIEELKKKIREKSEELEELKARKRELEDSRAEREAAIKAKIDELKAKKAEVEEEISKLEREIAQLEEELSAETSKLEQAQQKIEELEKDIAEKNERIQELQDKIDGKPSPEEQQLQARLDELESRIEQKKADFERLKAENAQKEQQLRQAYEQAIQSLVSARQNLRNMRARVQAMQDQIAALENRLYSSPALYDFFTRRANLTRIGTDLRLTELAGSSLPISPTQQLTELAQQFFRAPSANLKQQALDAFAAEKNRLISDLTQQCQGDPGCLGKVSELSAEANGLDQSLNDALSNPGAGGSPADWQALEDLQGELAQLEAEIRAAEQAVTQAEQAVTQAEQVYNDGLAELERSEQRLQQEIRDLEAEATQVGLDLADARRRAEEERLRNTPAWIDEIAQLRKEIEDLMGQLSDERRKAEAAQTRKLELENEIRGKKEQKRVLERQRDYLDEQIAREEQKLKDLDNEVEDLEQRIKELEAEIEKLKEDLKNLQAQRAGAAAGTRVATGQQVYFIPPPLEETDGFDGAKFEELQRNLGEKEAEFEKAKAAKEQVQDDAYSILKGMTTELWALRGALDAIESLSGEIDELEGEQSKRKADVGKERTAKAAEEREKQAEAAAAKTEKENELTAAKEAEERQKAMVDSQQEAVNKTADKVKAAQEKVARYQDAVTKNRELSARRGAELSQKRSAQAQSVGRLRDAEGQLARAKDTLSRAMARQDATAEANARSEVTRLEGEIETLQREIEAQRRELEQLSADFRFMQTQHADVENTLSEAQAELADWLAKGRLAVTTLEDETAKYDATVEETTLAERRLREAEDAEKAQNERADKANEATQSVDEDDDVKAAQEEIDKKKAEKDDAEKAKTRATNRLDALKQKRADWDARKKAADDALDQALKDLRQARDDLKAFLEKSFREVKHTITIKLTLQDMVADSWRTPDGPVQRNITIEYRNRRPPDVLGPSDNLTKPSRQPATPDICQVQADYVPEPVSDYRVDPDPQREDGRIEPQTIALFYKKGAPLYELWPPRRKFDDVLVAAATPFVTGGQDSDELTAQCSPGGGEAISVGVPGTLGDSAGDSVPQACQAGGSTGDAIVDIPHSTWMTDTYTKPDELNTMVNVPEVKPNECEGETELKVQYADSGLQWADVPPENPKTTKYSRTTGLKGDAPLKYLWEGKEETIELRFQVFDGAHKGKPDQTVEWRVTSIQPADMAPEDYGLNGTEKELLDEKTDATGYSKVQFTLKKPYGLAKVQVKWKRGDKECDSVEMEVVRPLKLRLIKAGFAPQRGWDQGEAMWDGDNDYEKLAKALPEDGPEPAPSLAVGLVDNYKDPVNDKKIEFSVVEPPEASMDPAEMATKIHGLAWSFATDVPEEAQLKMKAKVEAPLEPVTDPAEVEGEQSTETQNRFLIGPSGYELTIETDEPFVVGEAYSGGAKLVISGGDIPLEFKKLELQADGVMTEEGEGLPVAVDGSVSWTVTRGGGQPVKFTVPGFNFEFTLGTLGMTAGSDALITGKVKVPKREEEVDFEAQFGTA